MTAPEPTFCSRCGRDLPDGPTRYVVVIRLTAEFTGAIPARGGAEANERMWREIEEKSEKELLDEVVQELRFVLCKPCRDEWARRPFGGPGGDDDRASGRLH